MTDEKTSLEETPIDSRSYNGIVFPCTDGQNGTLPEQHTLNSSNIFEWFEPYPDESKSPVLKIVTHQLPAGTVKAGFDVPFSSRIIKEAIWGPEVYTAWTGLHSGSCAALLDWPVRMTLQTPNDGYPFISLAMAQKGNIVKGIYSYDHDIFDPIQMMPGETLYSGWRRDGLQVISLPQAVLRTHSVWLAKEIGLTLKRLQEVEDALAQPWVEDFAKLQRTLHSCSDTILSLERRSEFESVIITAIETVVVKLKYDRGSPWSALAPMRAAQQLRKADLEVIPRRIESARIAINDSILQRAQLQGLQLAQATQRIAEATMNDSASMKTIAILTMIFLPGTAVASFFSMTMWNWEAGDGEALVSHWLWIYFAVATPLTLGVIALWYFWMRIRTRQLRMSLPQFVTYAAPPYSHKVD